MTEARLIALDWGTTALRAWLLGGDGRILAARRSRRGLLATTAGLDVRDGRARARAYEDAFRTACGDWVSAHPDVPVLACGMVGSAQGWADAGYRTVPAELHFDAGALVRVGHRRGAVHLVPGLRMPSGDRPGDVIRGEETQIAGALEALGAPSETLTLVLPGTHGKWVRVDNGKVVSFVTAMSGELFGQLTSGGILAGTAAAPRRDDEAFARGLAAARHARGLAIELFGARPLVLDGLLDPASVPDYVSGVLIADEVAHLAPAAHGRIVLCGTADLCRRYATALAAHDVVPAVLTEDVTARGLWRIALSAGLVPAHDSQEDT